MVYVRNYGPSPLPNCADPRNWTVVVWNSSGSFTSFADVVDNAAGDPDFDFEEGETWVIYVVSLAQPRSSEFSVEVYGPKGTRAMAKYSP